MTKKVLRAKISSELIHSEHYGPINVKVQGGNEYFINLVDDHSRFGHVYLLQYKSDSLEKFREYKAEVENQFEAASYCNVTRGVVLKFTKKEPVCCYGLPEGIITDNVKNLNKKMVDELCEQFKINHRNSTLYRPKMNGAVEAANRNIKRIIKKMTITYKDWHEMLSFALHGYRTSVRTSTGATPFYLVYGMEAVLPLEVKIPSLRILMEAKLEEAEWMRGRYEQLNFVEEKRSEAEVEACLSDPLFIKLSPGAKIDVFSNLVKSSPDLKLRSEAGAEACLSSPLFIKPSLGAKVEVFSNVVKSSTI
ncbi:Pol polyprotein [Cucumis melo var. makuwa]|uniref:Pol polyprotein n=1 Tax=Cucumis melo var. makuwa TaxID=1194695 RepID=A0A5D3C279_CUCMM|nr:Pol polyprotein [Cucumis melo var. makuwa]